MPCRVAESEPKRQIYLLIMELGLARHGRLVEWSRAPLRSGLARNGSRHRGVSVKVYGLGERRYWLYVTYLFLSLTALNRRFPFDWMSLAKLRR